MTAVLHIQGCHREFALAVVTNSRSVLYRFPQDDEQLVPSQRLPSHSTRLLSSFDISEAHIIEAIREVIYCADYRHSY